MRSGRTTCGGAEVRLAVTPGRSAGWCICPVRWVLRVPATGLVAGQGAASAVPGEVLDRPQARAGRVCYGANRTLDRLFEADVDPVLAQQLRQQPLAEAPVTELRRPTDP